MFSYFLISSLYFSIDSHSFYEHELDYFLVVNDYLKFWYLFPHCVFQLVITGIHLHIYPHIGLEDFNGMEWLDILLRLYGMKEWDLQPCLFTEGTVLFPFYHVLTFDKKPKIYG